MTKRILHVVEGRARAYRRTWKGTAVTTFVNPLLFLLAMGVGLGQLVDRGPGAEALAGGSYLAFLAPGLLAATTMQTAAHESAWPVMAGIKWNKTYESALATPITVLDLVGGHLLWVVVRLAAGAVAFVLVMTAFGVTGVLGGALSIAPAVLTGLAFAAPIAAFTSTKDNAYGLAAMFRFGIVPLFLFSGTFFPVTQLPGWLQPVAFATPLWHGVELTRSAALAVGSTLHPVWHVAYLALWALVGAFFAVRLLERRMVR